MVAPSAQAATRRYDFQAFQGGLPGALQFHVAVLYKNKQRHGDYTPRQAIYDSFVPVSCNPPASGVLAPSGSYIYGTANYNYIKLKKGTFTYSYSSAFPTGGAPGSISAIATGAIKKKGNGKQLRVNGTVSILDYENPGLHFQSCTSGGAVPYSATPCRLYGTKPPPYLKPSLPVCFGGP